MYIAIIKEKNVLANSVRIPNPLKVTYHIHLHFYFLESNKLLTRSLCLPYHSSFKMRFMSVKMVYNFLEPQFLSLSQEIISNYNIWVFQISCKLSIHWSNWHRHIHVIDTKTSTGSREDNILLSQIFYFFEHKI